MRRFVLAALAVLYLTLPAATQTLEWHKLSSSPPVNASKGVQACLHPAWQQLRRAIASSVVELAHKQACAGRFPAAQAMLLEISEEVFDAKGNELLLRAETFNTLLEVLGKAR